MKKFSCLTMRKTSPEEGWPSMYMMRTSVLHHARKIPTLRAGERSSLAEPVCVEWNCVVMFCRIAHTLGRLLYNSQPASNSSRLTEMINLWSLWHRKRRSAALANSHSPHSSATQRMPRARHLNAACAQRPVSVPLSQHAPSYTDFPQHRRKRTLSHTLTAFYIYKYFFMVRQRCRLIFS